VHTTSPPRRSRGKDAHPPHPSPIKSIRLRVDVFGAAGSDLKRLAEENGLPVHQGGGKVSVVITSETPEDALVQLATLRGLFAKQA
jgi:hypothetical protein